MSKNYRALIIDDEKHGRDNLKILISEYCPELELIGFGKSGEEGINLIKEFTPEIVFLDIEMPRMNGFQMLESLSRVDFALIFVTAHDEFGIRAIKASATDYLLKPIVLSELIAAIKQAKKFVDQHHKNASLRAPSNPSIKVLLENIKADEWPQKIALHTEELILKLELNEIIYIEAEGNYARFFLLNGKNLLALRKLKYYEDVLDIKTFCRIHKSHIVNLNHVIRLSRSNYDKVLMANDITLDIARRRAKSFSDQLKLSSK